MKIDFQCGCFVSMFVENGKIRVALACCEEHDYPHANLHFFKLSLDTCKCPKNDYQLKHFLKAGYHGMCPYCKKPVITTTRWGNYAEQSYKEHKKATDETD